MHLEDLLSADRVALDQSLSSKKSLLEKAAELLALDPESAENRDIFEGLCQRERLGSTGLGHGVAIPHCRVEQGSVTGALIRLRRPIDFDSPDSEKVDLFFALSVIFTMLSAQAFDSRMIWDVQSREAGTQDDNADADTTDRTA